MKLIAALILIQMVGIVAAVVAAIVKIETILTTGPVLSLIGCVIVFGCFRKSHSLGLYFGISLLPLVGRLDVSYKLLQLVKQPVHVGMSCWQFIRVKLSH